MCTANHSVALQLTDAFRRAQSDAQFRRWLTTQRAAMQDRFPVNDCPDVRHGMYGQSSLAIVGARLLQLYPDRRAAFNRETIRTTMRYVYYVGETFRRAFDGTWVALPSLDDVDAPPARVAVDYPMREGLIRPTELVLLALSRRTGEVITGVYRHAERDHAAWMCAGRPERTFTGRR
jgi:hypothetical protein